MLTRPSNIYVDFSRIANVNCNVYQKPGLNKYNLFTNKSFITLKIIDYKCNFRLFENNMQIIVSMQFNLHANLQVPFPTGFWKVIRTKQVLLLNFIQQT